MNLLKSLDVHTLHHMSSAGHFGQMNTNVSNIENKTHHSEQAGEIKNKLLTDKHTTIWLPLFPTTMVLRLNIDQIEPATRDWICKVQIVEIGRPRESLDKKCTFQNLILEDEQECQKQTLKKSQILVVEQSQAADLFRDGVKLADVIHTKSWFELLRKQ